MSTDSGTQKERPDIPLFPASTAALLLGQGQFSVSISEASFKSLYSERLGPQKMSKHKNLYSETLCLLWVFLTKSVAERDTMYFVQRLFSQLSAMHNAQNCQDPIVMQGLDSLETGARKKTSREEDNRSGRMLCVPLCGDSKEDGGEGGRMKAGPKEDRTETEPQEGKGSFQKCVGQRGFKCTLLVN